MPSRRAVLLGAATVGSAAVAGYFGSLGDGPPAYADWLHDPRAVLPVERHSFVTLDAAAVRRRRETLPEQVGDALDRLDRLSESVSLSEVDRLTVLGYGDTTAGQAGVTLVARGSFDPAVIRRETGAAQSSLVTEEGTRGGFRLYAYAPSMFAALRRYRGPDQSKPPDLSFGLGVRRSTLVGGIVLAPDATGLDAVRAAVDARGADEEGIATDRDASDVLATVGDWDVAAGASSATLAALREQVDDPDVQPLLETARAAGVGYTLADETLRVALVVDSSAFDGPAEIRRLAERLAEAPDGEAVEVEQVGIAQSGRVAYADLNVPPSRIASLVDRVPTLLGDVQLSSD